MAGPAPRAARSGSSSATWPEPARPTGGPLVAPDTRASLVVLRPREGVALDASSVDLEAVFIDGREPGGSR